MSFRPIITSSRLRTSGQTRPVATSALMAPVTQLANNAVARENLYALALQRVPPPDFSNRTGELDRIVRFLSEPNMVSFTQWSATCRCGQVCALDKQTTYQWNNWSKHQRTCRLNKLEKESKNSQKELDDREDGIPKISSNLAYEENKRMEAAYDLLYLASNDVVFGTPREKIIISETLATHPSSFMEAMLLLSLKRR